MFFWKRNADRATENILNEIDHADLQDPFVTSWLELSLRNPATRFSHKNCGQLTDKLIKGIHATSDSLIKYSYAAMLHNLHNSREEDWEIEPVPVITAFVSAAKSIVDAGDANLVYDYAAYSIRKYGYFDAKENIVLAKSIFNALGHNEETLRGQSSLLSSFRKNTDARSFDFRKSPEIKELIVDTYNRFHQSELDVIEIISRPEKIDRNLYISQLRADTLDFIA